MRLGTCIALELAVAAGALAGVSFGALRATQLAGGYLGTPEAAAATAITGAAIAPLPSSELRVTLPPSPTVFGAPDGELLGPLGAAKVVRTKWNQGGSSISLRLDFANGTRAAFKPEQINDQSDPRRELAAYRLDRLLGLWRVPPAKPAIVPLADLLATLDPALRGAATERLLTEATVRDGMLHGELSWWIPEVAQARIAGHLVDERDGRVLWVSYLQVGARIPPAVRPLVEQLSACVLFDVLTDNADRWSGNNALGSPDGSVFYVMDNTMTFSLATLGNDASLGILRRIQVFPRRLVQRIRGLTEDQLAEAFRIGDDTKLGPLLRPQELRAILSRRDHLMKYLDQLIAAHGEDAVLALP